jgi:hypothetical protein
MKKDKQTTVRLPPEIKKAVRITAAELDMPMGMAALELIKIGLSEYKKTASDPLYADRHSAPMGGLKEAANA